MRLTLLICTLGASLGSLPALAQQEAEPAEPLHAYSARFFCSQPRDHRLPGECGESCWDTEIALSNPGRREAAVTIWAVEARPISGSSPPTRSQPEIELVLAPNDAVRLGCGSIDDLLPAQQSLGRNKKAQPNGFLRFESDTRLDAVATYVYRVEEASSDGKSAGVAIEVVQLRPVP